MSKYIACFVLLLAVLGMFAPFCLTAHATKMITESTQSARHYNPLLPVRSADPTLRRFGNRYYLYASYAGSNDDEPGFIVWSSPDLVRWKNEGWAIKFKTDLTWATGQAWAPDCVERNGKYYLYFSANSNIGVAVSDKPTGPFKDPLGKPLIPFKEDLSIIDPMCFIDDDGQAYLYYGAVPGPPQTMPNTKLSVRKLNPDMISFDGPIVDTVECQQTPQGKNIHMEGSFVLRRNGIYYLMWSEGSWVAAGGEWHYRLVYATSRSPLGPWERRKPSPFLQGNGAPGILATGHHSVIASPYEKDRYIICYHSHNGDRDRRVFLDWMEFAEDGTIKPVRPTWEGVGAIPLPRPATNTANKK